MTVLADINVWIALTFEQHVHHFAAKNWFDGLRDSNCTFCRMTQQGFLRLCTNRNIVGSEAVSLSAAWQLYDELHSDARVIFSVEPSNVESRWREFTRGKSVSPKIWNDAYLAAFAVEANFQIVTFDQGFCSFNLANCVVLS